MRKIFLLIFVLMVSKAFSQVGGETVYPFLNLPTSPKQIALGGVVLTAKNNVSQVLWNPSIASDSINNQIAVNYVNYISGINVGSLAYAKNVIKPAYGTAFLDIQYLDYGDLTRTSADGPTSLGSFQAKDMCFGIGYAYSLHQLSFGVKTKMVASVIDMYSSYALLYDFGVTYTDKKKPFVVAMSVRNIGSQLKTYDGLKEPIQRKIAISSSYQLAHFPMKIYIAIDDLQQWDISSPNPSKEEIDLDGNVNTENITVLNNAFRHFSFGGELWPDKKINLRIGYNQRKAMEYQLKDIRTNAGMSYGFGFNAKKYRFDYAFAKFQEGAKYSTFGLTLHL